MQSSHSSCRCVLVGNYGVGNIGDEALREYFLQEFPDIRWTVVTAAPVLDSDVPRLPLGCRSLFSRWWRTIQAIRRADALVFGGGSLFTDIESVRACMMWRSYAFVATFFGVPYILAFQGAGPWITKFGRYLAVTTYRHAAAISVRDQASLARVRELSPKADPVLSFDPAFALFARYSAKPVGKRLALIPRTNSDTAFFAEAKKASGGYDDVRILLMQPDSAEREMGERLKAHCGGSATVIEIMSVQQLLAEIGASSEVLAQRFHGALAAFAMGVSARMVPQKPGDKMDELNRLMRTETRETLLDAITTGAISLRERIVFSRNPRVQYRR